VHCVNACAKDHEEKHGGKRKLFPSGCERGRTHRKRIERRVIGGLLAAGMRAIQRFIGLLNAYSTRIVDDVHHAVEFHRKNLSVFVKK